MSELNDYFESDAFRENHVRRQLLNIVAALNELERLGLEPEDADYRGQSLSSLPFDINGRVKVEKMPRRTRWTIHYDTTTQRWVLGDN